MVWLANRDMELACDQAVVRRFGPEVRADYARTLLRFETGGGFPLSTPASSAAAQSKERIAALAHHKKVSLLVSGLVVLLAAGAALFWAFSPPPFLRSALRWTATPMWPSGETQKTMVLHLQADHQSLQEIQESGTCARGWSVTCYLSQKGNSPMGDAWFFWQDQQITSHMYGGCMFGATETTYPTPVLTWRGGGSMWPRTWSTPSFRQMQTLAHNSGHRNQKTVPRRPSFYGWPPFLPSPLINRFGIVMIESRNIF